MNNSDKNKIVNNYRELLFKHGRDPVEIFKFCIEKLSKKVVISHHYERCDVSVFVYR